MSTYGLGARSRVIRPSPLFLTVVAIAAAGGLIAWFEQRPGSRFGDFGVLLLVLGGWVVSVCFHEFAHAYAAYRAGDRSVEARGYLTLNPFKYAHPVLSILLPLVAIVGGGFALPGGAVYLHPHTFRSRRSRALAAAAGPLTNVVFALILVWISRSHVTGLDAFLASGGRVSGTHSRFWTGLAFLAFLQVTAAILNFLPVPGLDGYAILEPYLDPETQRIGEKAKPWGMLVALVLLFYVHPLRDAFLHLVRIVYGALGGNDLLYQAGYLFFQFWQKPPF
jgi:Zn-dependent protease